MSPLQHDAPIPLCVNLLPYLGTNNFSESGHILPTQSCQDSHWKEVEQSTTHLQRAQDNVFKKKGHQSASTHVALHTEFCCCNPQKVPYHWQVDVGEALHLGLSYSRNWYWLSMFLDPKRSCGCYFTLEFIRGGSGKYLETESQGL